MIKDRPIGKFELLDAAINTIRYSDDIKIKLAEGETKFEIEPDAQKQERLIDMDATKTYIEPVTLHFTIEIESMVGRGEFMHMHNDETGLDSYANYYRPRKVYSGSLEGDAEPESQNEVKSINS